MVRTGTGDGLHGSHPLLLDGGRVGTAQDELGSLAGEGGNTGDGSIFVVELRIVAENLICLLPGRRMVSGCELIPLDFLPSSKRYSRVGHGDIYLLDDGQHPGLCIVVTISTDSLFGQR